MTHVNKSLYTHTSSDIWEHLRELKMKECIAPCLFFTLHYLIPRYCINVTSNYLPQELPINRDLGIPMKCTYKSCEQGLRGQETIPEISISYAILRFHDKKKKIKHCTFLVPFPIHLKKSPDVLPETQLPVENSLH